MFSFRMDPSNWKICGCRTRGCMAVLTFVGELWDPCNWILHFIDGYTKAIRGWRSVVSDLRPKPKSFNSQWRPRFPTVLAIKPDLSCLMLCFVRDCWVRDSLGTKNWFTWIFVWMIFTLGESRESPGKFKKSQFSGPFSKHTESISGAKV